MGNCRFCGNHDSDWRGNVAGFFRLSPRCFSGKVCVDCDLALGRGRRGLRRNCMENIRNGFFPGESHGVFHSNGHLRVWHHNI
jgi:hypothetical protein